MKMSVRHPLHQAPRHRLTRPAVIVTLALLISSIGPLGGMPNLLRPEVAAAAVPSSATDVTKVPHYFGPYPNWANSPQTLADAMVKISVGTPTPVLYGAVICPLLFGAHAPKDKTRRNQDHKDNGAYDDPIPGNGTGVVTVRFFHNEGGEYL